MRRIGSAPGAMLGMIAVWMVLTGCRTTSFEFPTPRERLSRYGVPLVVPPLGDDRIVSRPATRATWWIPGFRTKGRYVGRPDDDIRLILDPGPDLARAFAELAGGSALFSQVTSNVVPVLPESLRLEGRLAELSCERRPVTYRLGLLASPLWFLGAPSGEMTTRVVLNLRLTDSSERVLWDGLVAGDRSRIRSLYANPDWRRAFVEDSTSIIRAAWPEIAGELRTVLENQ